MPKPKAAVEVRTPATVQQAAQVFQGAMHNHPLKRLLVGPTTFGRPQGGSPFDDLDGDPPVFSVYAAVPTSRNNQSVIHLYAWDREAFRELQVVALGGFASLGRHARKMTRRYIDELTAVAPGTEASGL